MEHIKRVLSYVRRAVDDYDMIRENLLDRMPPLDIDNAKARRAEEEQGEEYDDMDDDEEGEDMLYLNESLVDL